MVVSPKDIEKLMEDEKEIAQRLEQRIDRLLCKGTMDIRVSLFPNGKIRKYVCERYEAAGWKISYVYPGERQCDDRCAIPRTESEYIEYYLLFSPRKTKMD